MTIVLNSSNGKIYLIHHNKDDDMDDILYEKYNFNESEIEWMSVDTLQIETLQ